jgi:hypothetical protein
MVTGTISSILFSLYIKKTSNYRLALRTASIGSSILMIIFAIWLNTGSNKYLTTLLLALLGSCVAPTVPICFDLGCELAFPIG